ncbi:MAG: TldD/PmbA family protein [Alphaproteobacteria bacterium]|nr:TldD/PmbA family protein [Alphaproteobacteria bacterium]
MDREDQLDLLADLIAMARRHGADAADAVLLNSAALTHSHRLGKREGIERAEASDLGLRAFVGKRQAVASSTDLAPDALERLAEQAVAMAREAPEDPWCGLADSAEIARDIPVPETADDAEPSPAELETRAAAAEDAARAVAGVTNSEGAEASWSRTEVALAASNGFAGAYVVTRHSISAAVLAGEGTAMERDYDFTQAVFAADLEPAETIGRRAGERAVARLNPRKADTARVPVLFDFRVSGSLLRAFAGAISGPAVARGTSFLKDSMGKAVFAPGITIVDEPLRPRGLRTKPFDGEGIATERRALISDGTLQSWILDCASARQLGLATTGNAARGTSGPPSPSPTNLYMEPGDVAVEAMIKEIPRGILVTEMMGMGVNAVTGDYSRGAAGFWIEEGERAFPVSEVTVAGNLKDMYLNLTPAADLAFRTGTDAPTLRVDGMTVAGK